MKLFAALLHAACITRIQACDCPSNWVGDGVCDYACFNKACEYDYNDCDTQCDPSKCPRNWRADSWCDEDCNNSGCNYDFGDCSSFTDPYSTDPYSTDPYSTGGPTDMYSDDGLANCECPLHWIGDGQCDSSCDNFYCYYDGYDCRDYPEEIRAEGTSFYLLMIGLGCIPLLICACLQSRGSTYIQSLNETLKKRPSAVIHYNAWKILFLVTNAVGLVVPIAVVANLTPQVGSIVAIVWHLLLSVVMCCCCYKPNAVWCAVSFTPLTLLLLHTVEYEYNPMNRVSDPFSIAVIVLSSLTICCGCLNYCDNKPGVSTQNGSVADIKSNNQPTRMKSTFSSATVQPDSTAKEPVTQASENIAVQIGSQTLNSRFAQQLQSQLPDAISLQVSTRMQAGLTQVASNAVLQQPTIQGTDGIQVANSSVSPMQPSTVVTARLPQLRNVPVAVIAQEVQDDDDIPFASMA